MPISHFTKLRPMDAPIGQAVKQEGEAEPVISVDVNVDEATEMCEIDRESRNTQDLPTHSIQQDGIAPQRKGLLDHLLEVWERFPKFVIGFFLTSAIISLLELALSDSKLFVVQTRLKSASSWWFTLGFTAIGININLFHLITTVSKSPIVPLYIVGQLIDLILTFGAAQIAFNPKILG